MVRRRVLRHLANVWKRTELIVVGGISLLSCEPYFFFPPHGRTLSKSFLWICVLSLWKKCLGGGSQLHWFCPCGNAMEGKKKCLYPSDVGDFTVNANTLNLEVKLEEEVYPSCPREQCKSFQMLAALDFAQALGNGMN